MNAFPRLATLLSSGLLIALGSAHAQVSNDTLAAHAAVTGQPAGEASFVAPPAPASRLATSRAQVRDAVIADRQAGVLLPAGENAIASATRGEEKVTVTRAEVKAEVLAARAAGEGVPAGERSTGDVPGRTHGAGHLRTAQNSAGDHAGFSH